MKKRLVHIISAATASLFFSCTVSTLEEPVENKLTRKDVTFEAILAESGAAPTTKTSTVLDGDAITAVRWSPGDAINIFFVSGETVTEGRFTNNAAEAADRASFNGKIDIFSGTFESPVSDQMFRAVYPYSAGNTCDGSSITFSIPASQSSRAGSFSDGQWPTMARSNGLNLPFYAVCSGIKFKVAHEGVTSVTFTNLDGGAINGTVTAGWDDGNLPSINGISGGTDRIVVTPEGTGTFTTGQLYFAVLPTVTMSRGIEVTYKTATSHCTYINSNEISFTRNKFNKLYDKDTDYEEDPTPKYYKVTEAEAGQSYLIVSNGYALKNNGGAIAAEAVTDNDGVIMLEDATKLLWTACAPYNTTATDYQGLSFANDSKYLYRSSSSLGLRASASDKYSNFNYTILSSSNGTYCLKSGSSYKVYYSTSSKGWKAGTSSTAVTLYSPVRPKQDRGLAFAQSSISVVLGDTPPSNPLSGIAEGATDGVTYSSSHPEIADVNPSTGELTIFAAGSTTITASAAANDTFKAGEASYTLNVKQDGAWDLENPSVAEYFNEAATRYTDDNWSSVSIVSSYCSNNSSNRKDIPAPVSLSWPAAAGSGDYTVSVYNDSSHSDLEMSQTSSTTSADIYNLIPGRTYYYTVTRGTSDVYSGTFSTTGRRRMMKVSDVYAKGHANNCRDLGGLKTTDGKSLKYNLVFRGSNMDATTDEEKRYLTGYMNVRMDVDLRNGSTSSSGGDSGNQSGHQEYDSSWGVSYSHAGYNSETDLKNASKTKTTFTDIINTVTSGGACYIHCYVGADRTGYICALLEAVLGVSPTDISIDYELTSFSVVGTRTRNKSTYSDLYFKPVMEYITGYSKGSTFKEKAENILLDADITEAQISALRKAMLE